MGRGTPCDGGGDTGTSHDLERFSGRTWLYRSADGGTLLWAEIPPQDSHAKMCLGGQLFAFTDTQAEVRLMDFGELSGWSQSDLCSVPSSILISCEPIMRSSHLPVSQSSHLKEGYQSLLPHGVLSRFRKMESFTGAGTPLMLHKGQPSSSFHSPGTPGRDAPSSELDAWGVGGLFLTAALWQLLLTQK